MALSLEQFGKALASAGVLSADELKAFWSALPAAARPKTAEALAELLMAADRLTAYQLEALESGRPTKLTYDEYVVLAEIGAGGMGQVFKARHSRMDRVVALKVMAASAMKDEAAVKRFQREVRAAAKLEHPNIVSAYDSGECGKVSYLVMQYVDGRDLATVVRRDGALAIELAVDYICQAAQGLAFAHGEGVIHRDVKPANLLLDKRGVVKILDLGLARIDDATSTDGLTQSEQVMGTVDYMAPEQAADTKHVDGRADIYSLGCTLWFLLTGRRMYDGDTGIKRLMKHRDAPLPSLVKTRDDASWPLEQVFHKMVAKLPEERYATMEEVLAALEPHRPAQPSSTALGGSAGGQSGTRVDAELSAFFKTVGSTTANPVGGSSIAPLVAPVDMSQAESTAQHVPHDVESDPQSETIAGARKAAPAGRAATADGAGAKPQAGGGPLWKLVAGGVAALAALVVGAIVWMNRNDEPPALESAAIPHLKSDFSNSRSAPPPAIVPPAPAFDPAAERAAALFVLGKKGTLTISGVSGTISSDDKLPTGPFRIRSINMPESARVTDGDLRLIAGLTELTTLSLNKQQITDAGLVHLARLRNLQSLGLGASRVTDRGLVHLSGLTNLRTLVLYACSVSDDGLKSLAPLAKLAHLNVHNSVLVTDGAVDHFLGLPELRTVLAPGTGITAKGVARLTAARPGFQITWDSPPEPLRADDYALQSGKDKYIEAPSLDLRGLKSFTVEGYCRPRDGSYGQLFQQHFDVTSNARTWRIAAKYAGRSVSAVDDSADPGDFQKRTHLAAVFDDGEGRLFVDGRLAATIEADTASMTATVPFTIGKNVNAVVDEVRVSSTARCDSDFVPIKQFTSDAETLALYHCDEGAGDVLKDSSGNGHDGRIIGATWVRADGSPIAAP
jgi:serine/threonine protein kinase